MSLPDPKAFDGAVAVDLDARTVTVVPSEPGYPAMLWRQGYQRLEQAEQRGGYAPTVWASSPGHYETARGQPEQRPAAHRHCRGNRRLMDGQPGQPPGLRARRRPPA